MFSSQRRFLNDHNQWTLEGRLWVSSASVQRDTANGPASDHPVREACGLAQSPGTNRFCGVTP